MSLISALQTQARLYITEIADTNSLSDANLLSLLNYAAREFMRRAEAYPTSTTFTTTASTALYLLSQYVTTYASVHKDGLWWYNGTKWKQLDAETRASLSQKFPDWLNSAAGNPARYFIEGNSIYVHPKPSATVANALQLFHFARSQDGSAATKYIFTNDTSLELGFLVDYEDVLFDFIRAKVDGMNNRRQSSIENMNVFYQRCEEAKQKLAYRADLIRSYKPQRAGWANTQARDNLRRGTN